MAQPCVQEDIANNMLQLYHAMSVISLLLHESEA